LDRILALSNHGHFLATGSGDYLVRIYTLQEDFLPYLAHCICDARKWVFSVAFSADDSLLATGSGEGVVRVYKIAGGGSTSQGKRIREEVSEEDGLAFVDALTRARSAGLLREDSDSDELKGGALLARARPALMEAATEVLVLLAASICLVARLVLKGGDCACGSAERAQKRAHGGESSCKETAKYHLLRVDA